MWDCLLQLIIEINTSCYSWLRHSAVKYRKSKNCVETMDTPASPNDVKNNNSNKSKTDNVSLCKTCSSIYTELYIFGLNTELIMKEPLLGGINYTFLYRHSPFNVLKCKQHVLDRISSPVEQQRTRSGTAACATFVTLLIQHDFRRPSGGKTQRSWHKRRWGEEANKLSKPQNDVKCSYRWIQVQ